MNKTSIARSFGKAACRYAYEAKAQIAIVKKMAGLLTIQKIPDKCEILEIGCGTGFLSRELMHLYSPSRFVINDLCSEMKMFIPDNLFSEFICADAENYNFPGKYDLIASCSTMQWFEQPEVFIRNMDALLKPGGILALSTFGTENLQEIRHITGRGLNYLSLSNYREMFSDVFRQITLQEERIKLFFPSVTDVLLHLKNTGVNGNQEKRMTPKELKHLVVQYESVYREEKGIPLTYHPIYIIASKI